MSSDGVRHPGRDLPSLTGLRLVAALVVFVFHTSGYGGLASHWWRLASLGYVGVGFFFVLSGVVLSWSWRPEMATRIFWGRRWARVYPLTFLTAVLSVVVYEFVVPHHREPLWTIPLVLFLVHAWVPSQRVQSAADGVSWSLSCEAFFYLIFPVVVGWLACRRSAARWAPVVGLLVACSTIALLAALGENGHYDVIAYEEPFVRVGEFVLGIALGLALREGWVPRARPTTAWLALGVAYLALLGYGALVGWPVPRGIGDVVVLGPVVALILAYAGADLAGETTRMGSQAAVYLGQVSFAFYLVHQVVLDVIVERIAPTASLDVTRAMVFSVTGLAASLLLAIGLHHLVELPLQRRLSPRGRPRPTAAPALVSP